MRVLDANERERSAIVRTRRMDWVRDLIDSNGSSREVGFIWPDSLPGRAAHGRETPGWTSAAARAGR